MKGLLHGVYSGRSYEEYLKYFQRAVELDEKARKLEEQIKLMEQLITFFTLTATASNNPSQVRCLNELLACATEKKEELKDMVTI